MNVMPEHYMRLLLGVLYLQLLSGCTINADNSDDDADAYKVAAPLVNHADSILVVKEVKQMLDNYYRDIRSAGLTAELKYLDSTTSFFWVPPGYPSALSYESVVAILKQNAPMYTSVDNHFDTLSVIPLSKYTAMYTGRLRSVMADTLGHVNTYMLLETGVVIKRPAGWKLLSGQTAVAPD
jgi:hypothetical protein